jgi:hypothetical protein
VNRPACFQHRVKHPTRLRDLPGALPVLRRRDRRGRRIRPDCRQARGDAGASGAGARNARRAASPIVNVVGDHATFYLQYDALLTSDIVGLRAAGVVMDHESKSARDIASDAARAVQVARAAPGGIATLILPADAAWNPAERAVGPLPDIGPAKVAADTIEGVAKLLLEAAGRIAAKSGARLLCDTFAPHAEFGTGRVPGRAYPVFRGADRGLSREHAAGDPGGRQATAPKSRRSSR